jgi:uncharacterized protein
MGLLRNSSLASTSHRNVVGWNRRLAAFAKHHIGKLVMEHSQRGITMPELRDLRAEILRVAAARGAHNIRVFGSVARDQAGPISDVDFLVEMEQDRSALDVSELILDLEEILNRDVDVVVITRPTKLTEQIEREAIPL